MNYNQTKQTTGSVMPLLMGCTPPSRIQEEILSEPIQYDPISQKIYDMRTVGTKSLKNNVTRKSNSNGSYTVTDKKNEIDDSKSVR